MYELTIKELENQIRIIKQKLPSIDDSIKTYSQMAKNCQKERDDMTNRILEFENCIKFLKGTEDE